MYMPPTVGGLFGNDESHYNSTTKQSKCLGIDRGDKCISTNQHIIMFLKLHKDQISTG